MEDHVRSLREQLKESLLSPGKDMLISTSRLTYFGKAKSEAQLRALPGKRGTASLERVTAFENCATPFQQRLLSSCLTVCFHSGLRTQFGQLPGLLNTGYL